MSYTNIIKIHRSGSSSRFSRRLQRRRRLKNNDASLRNAAIANSKVCLFTPASSAMEKEEAMGRRGDRGGGGWQGYCAKWPRRRVWQSAHRAFVLSLMDYLYSPLSCSSDVYLTVDDIVPSYAEHSRNLERLSLAAREKGTPERDWRKQARDEIRRKRRHERDNTTTTQQALAATSNREKMLLRSQRYRALFWRTSARACQLRSVSANRVPPRCKRIIARVDTMYANFAMRLVVIRNTKVAHNCSILPHKRARAHTTMSFHHWILFWSYNNVALPLHIKYGKTRNKPSFFFNCQNSRVTLSQKLLLIGTPTEEWFNYF